MYGVYASCPLFLNKSISFSSPCSLLRPFSFPLSLTLFRPPFSRLSSFFFFFSLALASYRFVLFILCDIIDNAICDCASNETQDDIRAFLTF